MTNLRDGEPVVSPFSVHLGVEGYGISAEGHTGPKLGHFMVQVLAAKSVVQTQNLSGGATQATITLPNGNYVLRVRLVESGTGSGWSQRQAGGTRHESRPGGGTRNTNRGARRQSRRSLGRRRSRRGTGSPLPERFTARLISQK